MFRELVEELVVLTGLLLCMPYMITFLRGTGIFWFNSLALLNLIGLLCFSIIHAQELLKIGKMTRLTIFLILVIAAILVSGSYFWVISGPFPA